MRTAPGHPSPAGHGTGVAQGRSEGAPGAPPCRHRPDTGTAFALRRHPGHGDRGLGQYRARRGKSHRPFCRSGGLRYRGPLPQCPGHGDGDPRPGLHRSGPPARRVPGASADRSRRAARARPGTAFLRQLMRRAGRSK